MKADPVLEVRNLHKYYTQGTERLHILKGLNLQVQPAERVAVVGLSGSGKSTLLHLLGGLDAADEGDILLAGENIAGLSERQVSQVRNRYLGFIYQFHHLMADFTALENVMMPLLIAGADRTQAADQATELLQRTGLGHRLTHRPAQLSGGERQRVAIARALANRPRCVLADEPTGNLDEKTAAGVNDLMLELSESAGVSFVIVTHNPSLAQRMDRTLRLHNGQLQPEVPAEPGMKDGAP
ncbi:MAG: lipoprotein-releasing ABC transporter ATP-binding protein LolD [Pseudomonadales bacterium]|nr:lipoprotein-releasing ABC transporter ATP-binding protein LolD [Pseudomonadales bacterium]